MRETRPNVLTIAGSDPSGGAGLQADLKTFCRFGCYGTSVVTALTAQNTRGVDGVLPTPAEFVRAQLDTLLADVRLDAVKIGMLGSPEVCRVVAEALRGPLAGVPVVLDPVMVATSGDSLGGDGVLEALQELLPLVTLATPNLPEAAALSGMTEATSAEAMAPQAEAIISRGARAVLVKGGHLVEDPNVPVAVDLLVEGTDGIWLQQPWIATRNTHGTGCTLSSAIAARLAAGDTVRMAVGTARAWLTQALRTSGDLAVGTGDGHGPVNHFADAVQ